MRWHWQNLNEQKDSKARHGRAWFYLTDHLTFAVEWGFGKHAWSSALTLDKDCGDGNDLTLHIAIYHLFNVFLTITGLPFVKSKTIYDERRQVGIKFHSKTLWVNFWGDPTGWGPDRQKSFNVERFVFGRTSYSEENASDEQELIIKMPEGDYNATVKFYDAVWRFKRFRKPKRVRRADIEFDENNLIWFAGKGENSWDLDDDAIHEMTMSDVYTVEDVQKRLYEHIMKRRKQYGLPDNLTNHERLLNQNAMKLI